jgi:hypothetical protein
MVLVWSSLKGRSTLFFLICIFLLLAKEEYIPLLAGFLIWLRIALHLYNQKKKIKWRHYLTLFLIFTVCSVLSVFCLQHFKPLNFHITVRRNQSLESLFTWENIAHGRILDPGPIATAAYISLGSLGILLVLLFYGEWSAAGFLGFTIFSFVFCRLIVDRLIYSPTIHGFQKFSPGLAWAPWARVICSPMLALGTGYALYLSKKVKKIPFFPLAVSVWLPFSSILINCQYPPTFYLVVTGEPRWPIGKSEQMERLEIASALDHESTQSVILIPQSCWEKLLGHMEFVQYAGPEAAPLAEVFQDPLFHYRLNHSKYLIVYKESLTDQAKANLKELAQFDKYKETVHYALFKRNESRGLAIKEKIRYF